MDRRLNNELAEIESHFRKGFKVASLIIKLERLLKKQRQLVVNDIIRDWDSDSNSPDMKQLISRIRGYI